MYYRKREQRRNSVNKGKHRERKQRRKEISRRNRRCLLVKKRKLAYSLNFVFANTLYGRAFKGEIVGLQRPCVHACGYKKHQQQQQQQQLSHSRNNSESNTSLNWLVCCNNRHYRIKCVEFFLGATEKKQAWKKRDKRTNHENEPYLITRILDHFKWPFDCVSFLFIVCNSINPNTPHTHLRAVPVYELRVFCKTTTEFSCTYRI